LICEAKDYRNQKKATHEERGGLVQHRTRVVKTGNKDGNIVFLFHGINAGAPLTLEAVKELGKDYLLFAIDTIGQATMSDENRINIEDNSYALWG
jgi:hypothetical protein